MDRARSGEQPPCICAGGYNPECAWEGHLGVVRGAALDRIKEEARLEGFRDCEELVIAWLERTAATHPARHYPALALALAVRMGEHMEGGDGR